MSRQRATEFRWDAHGRTRAITLCSEDQPGYSSILYRTGKAKSSADIERYIKSYGLVVDLLMSYLNREKWVHGLNKEDLRPALEKWRKKMEKEGFTRIEKIGF